MYLELLSTAADSENITSEFDEVRCKSHPVPVGKLYLLLQGLIKIHVFVGDHITVSSEIGTMR